MENQQGQTNAEMHVHTGKDDEQTQPISGQPENVQAIFQEAQNQWQQFAMLLLWKLKGQKKVFISLRDVANLRKEFEPGMPCTFISVLPNGVEFQIVSEKEVSRRAEAHQQEQQMQAANEAVKKHEEASNLAAVFPDGGAVQ